MSKKNKQRPQSSSQNPAGRSDPAHSAKLRGPAAGQRPDDPAGPLFSRRGKIAMALGAALALAGFYLVTWTDPAGQNWASQLCPFAILGGYALIGLGIVMPDPAAPDAPASPSH